MDQAFRKNWGRKRIVWIYLIVLLVLLLIPFDFQFPVGSEVEKIQWFEDSKGLEFVSPGSIRSPSSPERLYASLVQGSGLSIEAWLQTDHLRQTGPARIISYSKDPGSRNFTLGQSKRDLVVRLRTTETDENGVKPHLKLDDVFVPHNIQHILVTYDYHRQTIYVNGEPRLEESIPGGDFSSWDRSYPLVLGNEATGDRPWLGKLHLVAIYNRPLSTEEVQRNFSAGPGASGGAGGPDGRVAKGLVVQYSFKKHLEGIVLDESGLTPSIDMEIQTGALAIRNKIYLENPVQHANLRDIVVNILIFLPFGFLFFELIRVRYNRALTVAAIVLVLGALFSFAVESLQYFLLSRYSSMMDILSNTLGTALGVALVRPLSLIQSRWIYSNPMRL